MKRKIYDELMKWKNRSHGGSALLIEGARRVGKSYIAEEFGRNEYRSYIVVDFSNTKKAIVELFTERMDDIPIILRKISDIYSTNLYERESLIIFDEIQKCPEAREMIKHLVEDGRYDYIETGSLVSIHDNVKDILIPSEEERINMYPMDFEEFCWATGKENLIETIKEHFVKREPMGDAMHRIAMDQFRQYMIVGGMPMSVKMYSETRDFSKSEYEKRKIIELYGEDIGKKSRGLNRKVRAIFEQIPSELSKHDKTLVLSDVGNRESMSDFEEPLFWLEDSRTVNICYNTTEPSIGLMMNIERTKVKCYLGDTGLLVSMAINDDDSYEHELFKALLTDRLHINEGMFAENVVAQILKTNGHKLFFHVMYDHERNNNRYEIDFLIREGKKISPIEVKSGRSDKHASLDLLMKKYSKHLGQAYILHSNDLKKQDGILYLPLYMAICL